MFNSLASSDLIYIADALMLFVCLKPYLPPSASRVEYDSEESQGSEDEEDDDEDEEDSFDPNSPLAEHSNSNSYR